MHFELHTGTCVLLTNKHICIFSSFQTLLESVLLPTNCPFLSHIPFNIVRGLKQLELGNQFARSGRAQAYRYSGFSSHRINLSPFTKDFRGEEQNNESKDLFFKPYQVGCINLKIHINHRTLKTRCRLVGPSTTSLLQCAEGYAIVQQVDLILNTEVMTKQQNRIKLYLLHFI